MTFDPATAQATTPPKKNQKSTPPPSETPPENPAVASGDPPSPAPPADPPADPIVASLLVELPCDYLEGGYASPHVEANKLLPRQAAALKRLRCSLAHGSIRVPMRSTNHPKGRVVDSAADAVRWLLEQYADHWELETGKDITEGLSF